MIITKLTDDSSWLIETSEFCLVIDPWFTEKQVDFSAWFSLQSRKQSYGPFAFSEEKELLLFISHPFSDHCNKETLLTFPRSTPIFAVQGALKKIKSWNYFDCASSLGESPFEISQLTKPTLFNQTHHAFLMEINGISFLYAPHGVKLSKPMPSVDVLLTTTTQYKLPFFLGGTVNLGLSVAKELIQKSNAKLVLATHDQQKESRGLVGWFARPTYAQDPALKTLKSGESLTLTDFV